jgi:very-short-patch-repair endonuclease
MSLPEVLLWQRIRGRKTGVKFRNQHPIGSYVVDFYCSELRLVIEVDGEVHNHGDRPTRDERREAFLVKNLVKNGYRVVRVPASDILKDADDVASSIALLVDSPLHHAAARRGPPPRSGEEF